MLGSVTVGLFILCVWGQMIDDKISADTEARIARLKHDPN